MDGKPSLYGSAADGCWLCESTRQVEVHHIYPSSRRPISDREGCTIPLCHYHHQGLGGVHNDKEFDMWLRKDCQRRWEEREGLDEPDHETFRSVFYESYL